MIKNFFCATLLGLFTLPGFAQKGNSVLWEITGKSLKQPSYLFGTVHITCDATLKPKVLKALDKTDQVYLEIDMDDPELNNKMLANLNMKDEQRISEIATPEQYKTINTFLESNFGIPLQALDTYKPFFIQSMLYTKMIDCPMQSFEMELVKKATEDKEEILGLETIESQLAIFDEIAYKNQIEDTVTMIEAINAGENNELQELIAAYQNENLDELMRIIASSEIQTNNQFQEELLIKRNHNWIPIIIEQANQKPTFFGVGAAHLKGKDGVIQLLQKQGYKVKPVQ
ncbi:TraB/GumN family protein [Flavobacterium agricola]|uniref:TraB/GumN family protein n=1 Tax=Flavobacterium agricola TaxID=2870839 RepID=A0ABY6LZC5_9FLAO|nr:TraB/GumN family protein [Flavobacterium agricola]UYW01670.1 TraB/GumN family protein [Flavobacterium agricola]